MEETLGGSHIIIEVVACSMERIYGGARDGGGHPKIEMQKSHVQPNTPQSQPHNDNNSSLLMARESSVLKYNRLVCLIIWRGGRVTCLVTLTILYECQMGNANPYW